LVKDPQLGVSVSIRRSFTRLSPPEEFGKEN
jgi:hypothetical protein